MAEEKERLAGTVELDYTNYRDERKYYRVVPLRIWYGTTQYHPQPGWLLEADDVVRGFRRTFALARLHAWRDLSAPPDGGGPRENREHYRPMESPNRYPLELRATGDICLWCEDRYKIVIARFEGYGEEAQLRWVGDRPLMPEVDFAHFRELAVQGYDLRRRVATDAT